MCEKDDSLSRLNELEKEETLSQSVSGVLIDSVNLDQTKFLTQTASRKLR
jgi:hypothetical protein